MLFGRRDLVRRLSLQALLPVALSTVGPRLRRVHTDGTMSPRGESAS